MTEDATTEDINAIGLQDAIDIAPRHSLPKQDPGRISRQSDMLLNSG